MADDGSRTLEEQVTQLQAELARVTAERNALRRVIAEALRLLTPQQFGQLRATLDEADREGNGGNEDDG